MHVIAFTHMISWLSSVWLLMITCVAVCKSAQPVGGYPVDNITSTAEGGAAKNETLVCSNPWLRLLLSPTHACGMELPEARGRYWTILHLLTMWH
jgi:hypothetical protein